MSAPDTRPDRVSNYLKLNSVNFWSFQLVFTFFSKDFHLCVSPVHLTCASHLSSLSCSGLLELNVSGCPWPVVSALCQAVCPCLKLLDLSRVEDLKDSHLRELLAPPPDTRTGETLTHLH